MVYLRVINLVLIGFFLSAKIQMQHAQDDDDDDDDAVGHGKRNFIQPEHIDGADVFLYNTTEFVFVNRKMSFDLAAIICRKNYHGNLAIIKEFQLANFLAEALAETGLVMDSLWLGATRHIKSDEWYWIENKTEEKIAKKIVDTFVFNEEVKADDRSCLSFSRMDHDMPQFRPLDCKARRAAMCKRPQSGGGDNNSTHQGWIKLGRRYYKIFDEHVNWNTAVVKCFEHDHDATLAVVTNFDNCQQLGRYLLIGRPSLENAWIDAKYIGRNYKFEQENLILANESDDKGYPPWRGGKVQKIGGCILLDRHLANVSLFVEARCSRLRPYICYKMEEEHSQTSSDVIIGNHGYRLHYQKKSWFDALNFCKDKYGNYSANLAEVREKVQLYHLLYVMGENKTAVRHIWLGGKLNETLDSPTWMWQSDQKTIPTGDEALLNWVKNKTYTPSVEQENVCLKMDRENHIVALNYGAVCAAHLCFVCAFTKEELLRLEIDERIKLNMAGG